MNKQRLLDRFLRYINCPSESGSERSFCELIEQELSALGLEVKRGEVGEKCGSNGFNLYAFLPGDGEPLLLSAHLDTVSPGVGIRPVIEDGVIRSSGDTILGADDKSGVAAILEALETLHEGGLAHRPVEVLFSICEELGLLGAKYADYSLFHSKQAIVFDSSANGAVVNRSPANVVLHIAFQGKSAHAGVAPEQGIHALKAAAEAVSHIPCGHVDELTVMNVANFLAPGKTNVVPAQASFDMEIRSFEEETLQKHLRETEQAVKDACEKFGTQYTLSLDRHSDVLYVPEDCKLVTDLFEVYRRLGAEPFCKSTYGGCDATWLFANGIDAVNVGSLTLEKLEAMTCVCSVGLDMIAIPGKTKASTIAGIIADEMAIGMVNQKTTAVRLIPVIGKDVGETAEFGGLLGYAPIIPVNEFGCDTFISRKGRIPAPIHSFKN